MKVCEMAIAKEYILDGFDASGLGIIADQAIFEDDRKTLIDISLHVATIALTAESPVERIRADGIVDRIDSIVTRQQG